MQGAPSALQQAGRSWGGRALDIGARRAPPLPEPASRDPDDDAALALAVAARPDLIITGDKDLLVLGAYAGIPIVSATEALARIAPRL